MADPPVSVSVVRAWYPCRLAIVQRVQPVVRHRSLDNLAVAVEKLVRKVRRIQELRRSNATTPIQSRKKYNRARSKAQLKKDITDNPR